MQQNTMFLEAVVVMDGSKVGSSYSYSFRTFNYGSHFSHVVLIMTSFKLIFIGQYCNTVS